MKDSRIVNGSMGSFLLPPTHPGHLFEVETDLTRKKENRGSMALEYAAFDERAYVDTETREAARKLITDWQSNKAAIDSKEVQEWILAVNNHMGGGAAKYIRKYYPEYKGITV